MDYNEMLEILRGKVLIGEDIATIQQRLNEIADTMERLIVERDAAVEACNAFESHWEWRGVQDEL